MADRSSSSTKFSSYTIKQLLILSLCRFAEPIALTSIFPYLYYMIKSFGVPAEDVSFYAGITASSFAVSQFLTGIMWGRLSDKIGRKPIIILGLIGTMASLVIFGFSTSLIMAISARSLSGLVNGNVGILRTMVAEMVPQKKLQPHAFSIMPLVWNIGSIMGPMIGGALADPIKNHPEWFHGSTPALFKKFPFALPNLVCALVFMICIPIGILFLDETLEDKRSRRDPGRELGKRLTRWLRGSSHPHHHKDMLDETTSLLASSEDEETVPVPAKKKEPAPPMRDAFTYQSTMNIVYYAFLALHSISFDQLLPVFLSYPPQDAAQWELPFKFAGGFGMSSSRVGQIFSVYGICGMLLQAFVFPPAANRLGAVLCLRIVAFMLPVIYGTLPLILLLPAWAQMKALYALMFCKSLSVTLAFPCTVILLTNSSPSLRVLGTLNGVAVAVAALGRAIGPTVGGLLFSYGQKTGYLLIPWLTLSVIGFMSAFQMLLITDKGGMGDHGEDGGLKAGDEEEEERERR